MIAFTLIGIIYGGYIGGHPKYAFIGGFVGGINIAPFTWVMKNHGRIDSSNRPTNIFY